MAWLVDSIDEDEKDNNNIHDAINANVYYDDFPTCIFLDSIIVSLFEDILDEFDKSDIFAKYIGCELVLFF